MATNPMFNNRTSPNGATAPNNPANTSDKRYSRKHNKFDYSRKVYNTLRFADITPFESVRGVEADILPFGSKHQVRTFTFKSPLMSDIFMRKTFFHVDYRCILPLNWDKWYKAPKVGDDVEDDVGTSVNQFLNCVYRLNTKVRSIIESTALNSNAIIDKYYGVRLIIQHILIMESLFSSGSLLASLGCHLQGSLGYFYNRNSVGNMDSLFEDMFSYLGRLPITYTIDDQKYTVPAVGGVSNKVPFRVILDLIRNCKSFTVTVDNDFNFVELFNTWLSNIHSPIDSSFEDSDGFNDVLNLDVLYAYQIVCSQFYTNTNVDYVYNSEIYRQNQKSLLSKFKTSPNFPSFVYNGITCDYDVCSGRYFAFAIEQILTPITLPQMYSYFAVFFDWWRNIFFYQRSLKYGDYFTGSKTRPLAVGDVNVTVNSGQVSAIDMTRNIMKQRFLNAVNRVRNTMSDYLSKVLDGQASPRDDEPRFLASVKSKLSGFEVENTSSEEQGKLVKVINSSDSNYIYEVSVGSPCIILGLASFEIPSVYSRGIERFFMNKSREDMFNPFMQYIGDQSIYRAELTGELEYYNVPFGYQFRHSEYKQRTSFASGAFVNDNSLQSYVFLVDNISDLTPPPLTDISISPEFIRNKNYEIDRFYTSLTGLSLSNYFHFIVEFTNICEPSREMDYSPTIL